MKTTAFLAALLIAGLTGGFATSTVIAQDGSYTDEYADHMDNDPPPNEDPAEDPYTDEYGDYMDPTNPPPEDDPYYDEWYAYFMTNP